MTTIAMIDPDDPQHSDALERALADALAPIDPGAPRRKAIRERLFERARAHGANERRYGTVLAEQGEWKKLSAGVRAKTLCRDAGSRSLLLEVKQDAVLPPH